jgi:N-acetylmuramoyl-L-alanine amidase
MNERIYISPSSQPTNTYAVGNTNEQEQCRKIASALEKELDSRDFIAKAGLSGTMYTRVAESNNMGADLHLPIHTNGFDGKVAGLRIMISRFGGEAEQIAKAIMATLAPITPGTSDGISVQSGIYEINASKAICVYIEVGFHDNPEEALWIINHTQDIAVAIADGLCNHYGVKYSAPSNSEVKNESSSTVNDKKEETTTSKGESTVNVELNVLQKGSNGEQVKALQRMLHAMGYNLGTKNPCDGDFGSKTDTAVRAYQKLHNLYVDGIVGAKTWNKLLKG